MPYVNDRNTGTVTYNTGNYSDEDYLKQIEQYKGNSWYNRLLENPWLASKQAKFSPNFWQGLGETFLQDYSARDKYYAELQSNQNQWLSDMLQQLHQQDYDSPIEQVQREKEAGLNPDLNPGSISSGQAAENDQPIMPNPMQNSGTSSIPELFSLGNTIISSAMQFANAFQSMRGVSIENRLKSLNLTDALKSSVWSAISEGTGEFLNSAEDFNPENIIKDFEPLAQSIMNRIDRMPYSHRNKKAMKSMVQDMIFSVDSEGNKALSANYQKMYNDAMSSLSKSRNEFAKNYSLPGGSLESPKTIRWISNNIYKPIEDMQVEVMKLMTQYNKSYYGTASGALKGEAENSLNSLNKDILGVKNRIVKSFESINKRITGSSDLSPLAKLALEAGVSTAEALVFSKLQIR